MLFLSLASFVINAAFCDCLMQRLGSSGSILHYRGANRFGQDTRISSPHHAGGRKVLDGAVCLNYISLLCHAYRLAPFVQRLRMLESKGLGRAKPKSPRIIILTPTAGNRCFELVASLQSWTATPTFAALRRVSRLSGPDIACTVVLSTKCGLSQLA